MPAQKADRFMADYDLPAAEAFAMSQERDIAEFFEAAVQQEIAPRKTANWIAGHLLPALKDRGQGLSDTCLSPERFAGLLRLLDQEKINTGAAREVLARMIDKDAPPEQIISEGGFEQVSDADKLEDIVDAILAEHPDDVADYKNGNPKVLGFFMGLAMKASQGKANPKLLKEILAKRLGSQ